MAQYEMKLKQENNSNPSFWSAYTFSSIVFLNNDHVELRF